jgi:hypothetical protein
MTPYGKRDRNPLKDTRHLEGSTALPNRWLYLPANDHPLARPPPRLQRFCLQVRVVVSSFGCVERYRRPSFRQELLATVDVIGCPCESRVCHEMQRKLCDIVWAHDAADRQCGAELGSSRVELVTQQ